MQSVRWAHSLSIHSCPTAVQAAPGVYVATAYHNGGLIPGVATSNNVCQVSWGGATVTKHDFYLLENAGNAEFIWQAASSGQIPMGAVQGGYSENGEPLYVGRFRRGFKFITGKVHPSHRVCYVPDGGREVSAANYEVLCLKTIPLVSLGLH
ncbi:hypothetical protein SK128_022179 [Halocaridina rubra]|uniref:Uncharacterized protein n=1 Tax=Halocaridina rubra TaxID=373956 RepID=A0AAN9A0D4_HALRR